MPGRMVSQVLESYGVGGSIDWVQRRSRGHGNVLLFANHDIFPFEIALL